MSIYLALSRVVIFENAILLYSRVWMGENGGSKNNYVLMLDTSNCACSYQRWYCLQQSSYIALSVDGQKRLKKRNV